MLMHHRLFQSLSCEQSRPTIKIPSLALFIQHTIPFWRSVKRDCYVYSWFGLDCYAVERKACCFTTTLSATYGSCCTDLCSSEMMACIHSDVFGKAVGKGDNIITTTSVSDSALSTAWIWSEYQIQNYIWENGPCPLAQGTGHQHSMYVLMRLARQLLCIDTVVIHILTKYQCLPTTRKTTMVQLNILIGWTNQLSLTGSFQVWKNIISDQAPCLSTRQVSEKYSFNSFICD